MNESPCKKCQWIDQDKKLFAECVNCEKRFGGTKMHFQVPFVTKKPYHKKRDGPYCHWPHGCTNLVVKAYFCTEHSNLVNSRCTLINKRIEFGKTFQQQEIYEYLFKRRQHKKTQVARNV